MRFQSRRERWLRRRTARRQCRVPYGRLRPLGIAAAAGPKHEAPDPCGPGASKKYRRRPTLPGPCEAQVPSALRGLTSLFGMGRGVSPSLSPPEMRVGPPQDRAPLRALKTAQQPIDGQIKKSVKPSTH